MRFVAENYINYETVGKAIYNRIVATKRISKPNVKEEDVITLLKFIANINSLDYLAEYIGDVRLADLSIPSSFQSFLAPSRVMIDDNERNPDLRIVASNDVRLSILELVDIVDRIGSTFRGELETVNVKTSRVVCNINNAPFVTLKFGSEYRLVAKNDDYGVPLILKSELSELYSKTVFNEDAEYILEQYIAHWTPTLKSSSSK